MFDRVWIFLDSATQRRMKYFQTAGWCLLFVGPALAYRHFRTCRIPNRGFGTSIVNYCRRLIITHFSSQFLPWSRRIYGFTGSPRVYRCANTAIKFGSKARPYEAETTQYIGRHTSIPVPKIIDVWTEKDGSPVTVFEWVDGERLEDAWPTLSSEEKKSIGQQLREHLDALRALHQPFDGGGWIGSYNKKPISDALLLNDACGPFASDADFNRFLLSRFEFMKKTRAGQIEYDDLEKEVLNTPRRRIVFTHSDIMPRNILIDSRRKIVALLDWEMSGWMPEQWEYLKAMWMGQYDPGWPEFVAMWLDPYDDDLKLHNKMCKLHGAPF